ncbi:MAG: hypothetical protein M3P16_01920 [Chloroflexota bacterium]|nr:hypothetical protein [Chloroflexota bacterium]
MRRGELADRGQGPHALLGQRTTEGVGHPEGGLAADTVGIEPGEIRLGFAQREAQRVDDETAVIPWVASTRRTRP